MVPSSADVVVIGAGFGGLATSLRLSELGARVVLLETLDYPGGCASTYSRDGFRFESGATLFSGFGPNQLFRQWIERYGLDVTFETLDPVVELRAPGWRLAIPLERDDFVARLMALPEAPRDELRAFFDRQARVADVLWWVLDDPSLLPPFGLNTLGRHARKLREYAALAPFLGTSLLGVLRRYGLEAWSPLRLYLDALCQITVQCPARKAEALFALGTMDYYFRGTGHVRGGIGQLATGLVEAVRSNGSEVSFTDRVSKLTRRDGSWIVQSRRGSRQAPVVVANLLPQNVAELVENDERIQRRSDELARGVERGWGACMLYRVVRAPADASPSPHHLQLVNDASSDFVEGNHVFCSFSGESDLGRAPEGYRTLTVSTHVPVSRLKEMTLDEQGDYVEHVQQKMRETLSARAPEWEGEILHELTASPRTFERFTKRYFGYVGGIPRTVGWHNYRNLVPGPLLEGLYLVGDSVFPGQSTLATALGGVKLAERLAG